MTKKDKKPAPKKEEKEEEENLLEEIKENAEKRLDEELSKYKEEREEEGEIILEGINGIIKDKNLPETMQPLEKMIDKIKENENVTEIERKEVRLDIFPGYNIDNDDYEKVHKISEENFKAAFNNQMNENASEDDLKNIFNLLKGNENGINVVALKGMINNIFDDDKKEGNVDPDQVDEVYSIEKLSNLIKRATDNSDIITYEQFKAIMQRNYY